MRGGSNRQTNQHRGPVDTCGSQANVAVSSLGLNVHAGRAVVVILRGTRRAPEMVLRHGIDPADPWVRESMHPYHQELGDQGPEGVRARRRGCAAAGRAARRAIRSLVRDMRSHGLDPRGAAIVVASLAEPARIKGAHARAHAEERKLYREAVENALGACGLGIAMFLETSVRSAAAAQLRLSGRQIDAMLKVFVRQVGTPWRAPEKQAALAAWLALSKPARRKQDSRSAAARSRGERSDQPMKLTGASGAGSRRLAGRRPES